MKPANPLLSFIKIFLLPFSLLYGLGVRLRNLTYDRKIYKPIEFSLPVISVGNISVGGTGKTPHIEYLIELLNDDFQLATMSRGYKRKTKGFLIADQDSSAKTIGDEPLQYHLKFPEVIVSVSENRLIGIPQLVGTHPEIDIILLDDAYQHRSIKPGMNILLTDFQKPFFKDHLLPYGRLREQRSAYERADIIIVSKCPPHLPIASQEEFISHIKPYSNQEVYFTYIEYGQVYNFYDHSAHFISRDSSILLLCGIANPQPILSYLKKDYEHIEMIKFKDHHYFSKKDIQNIIERYKRAKEGIMLTTEKDAMRLYEHRETLLAHHISLYVLPIKMKFIKDSEQFKERLYSFIKEEQAS